MFNITEDNNNISFGKPVEHIDIDNGLHVSACTSCTRTMRVRRDIAIDITESVQLLVRFNALRSMPVMPKLEHYNVDAMHAMAAAALATCSQPNQSATSGSSFGTKFWECAESDDGNPKSR